MLFPKSGHIITYYFVGIIKAAREEKGNNLDTRLKTEQNKLKYDCYNRALKAAVEKDRCGNASCGGYEY